MNVSTATTHCITGTAPAWYLLHCKPRQDECAEEHLLRQGYVCYRPQQTCERIVRGRRQIVVESLFPGSLFIQHAQSPATNQHAAAERNKELNTSRPWPRSKQHPGSANKIDDLTFSGNRR